MDLIKISNLTKTYKIGSQKVDVLKNINLTLPQKGLVVILGKSGSGKSTLLNIVGGLDKQSKGKIEYIPKKKVTIGTETAFIFQHYHLLENETSIYNIMLPALIQGFSRKFAEKQATELIKLFKLDESITNKEVKFLSGGEKERIAILRALITNPKVILADEPTGALDTQNSIKTMEILKNASKKKLVLLVTHNLKLAYEYGDRIVVLNDGKIDKDEMVNNCDEEIFYSKLDNKHHNNWSSTIINHNFKKRIKRNLVSILGMTISLTFCYLLFGFSSQSHIGIEDISKKHFDYGTSILRKELRSDTGSSISLVKTLRPNEEEVDDIVTKFPSFEIMPNYDQIFSSGCLYLGNKEAEQINISFVLDFSIECFDTNLFVSGGISEDYSWNNIIVNEKAYKIINDSVLHYKITYENSFDIQNSSPIVDILEIDEELKIIGVVDEFDFLSTPKIYFDYKKIERLLDFYELENFSDYKNEVLTWKDLVSNSSENDDISSYSVRCFLKDINRNEDVENLSNYLENDIKLENDSLTIKEALFSLTEAASVGLNIFLIIALTGSVLIIGVFSYSAYSDDKKESSILTCLGAKDREVVGIFACESFIVVFFSFLFSTVLSAVLESPLNSFLTKLIDIPNLIKIPFKSFLGIKGLLPIGIFLCSLILTMLFSSIPILLNKKISLKKELSDL